MHANQNNNPHIPPRMKFRPILIWIIPDVLVSFSQYHLKLQIQPEYRGSIKKEKKKDEIDKYNLTPIDIADC